MYVKESVYYNPKTFQIEGGVSKIKEQCPQHIENLLTGKGGFKPSHVMLQLNLADMRSGWYWEGPSFGSQTVFKGDELYRIVVKKFMRNMHFVSRSSQWRKYNIKWKTKIIVTDCAKTNVNFAKKCMNLPDGEVLYKHKTLKFKNPWGNYYSFIVWCADHTAKNVRNQMCQSYVGSDRWHSKGGKMPIIYDKSDIDWKYLKLAAAMCNPSTEFGDFGGFKRLTRKSVQLGKDNSWEKMRMTHYYAVTCPDTLAGLKWLIANDPDFEHAQATLDFLTNLAGIFNGEYMAPKQSLAEDRYIWTDKHKIFKKHIEHLDWFEKGFRLNPKQWLNPETHSRLKEFVLTSHEVASDFFEHNRKNKEEHFFMFFRLSNRRLESSNGVIRALKCDNSVDYETGKGIQRFYLSIRYETVFTDIDEIKNKTNTSNSDNIEMKENDS